MGTSIIEQIKGSLGRPQGVDWIAVVLAVIAMLFMALLACSFGLLCGLIVLFLFYRAKDTILQAIWRPNVFAPLMIHLVWGGVIVLGYIALLIQLAKIPFFIDPTLFVFTLGALVIGIVGLNVVHYIGCWLICKFYPESKPQSRFARLLVTLGIIIIFFAVKNYFLGAKNVQTGDVGGAVAGSTVGGMVTSTPSDMTMNGAVGGDMGIDSSTLDTSTATAMNMDTSSIANGGDTQIHFTDDLSQADGSMTIHNDGSADMMDSNMQYAGQITDSGQIFNALNLPDGHMDGNTIFNSQNQIAYTIEGDTIYDKLHQVAYTVRDGNIYDMENKLIGKMS